MTYNLSIGRFTESNLLEAGSRIASATKFGKLDEVSAKLNAKLFNGGPSAPKSFGQLFSISNPSEIQLEKMSYAKQNPKTQKFEPISRSYTLAKIEKRTSFSAVYGILEGIPVLGSILAIIGGIGHYLGMKASLARLKTASTELLEAKKDNKAAIFLGTTLKSQKVVNEAINYTAQKNNFNASLLSLIPFLKPIVRLFQLHADRPQANARPSAQPDTQSVEKYPTAPKLNLSVKGRVDISKRAKADIQRLGVQTA